VEQLTHEKLLQIYALPDKRSGKGDFFPLFLLLFSFLFGLGGVFLYLNKPAPLSSPPKAVVSQARFIVKQEKTQVVPEVKKEKKKEVSQEKKKPVEEPVDLTKKPLLNQKTDDIVKEEQFKSEKKAPRRIYGLRKVYSTGLGAQGNLSDAIVGKLGNTLNTDIDTFKATEEDLKGELVSTTTLTREPRLKVRAKPQYTKEMIEKRIEGVVRVKVLIDSDGKVKKIIVLDDLGYGSREKVYDACLKLVFEPALRDDVPVAVWQIIRFRFELTEG